jgi:two-component system, chemotaxis family, protein-glutamate methylesterase/glutaminase
VMYSRPSIDVLFESAAIAYGEKLVAIILTGANHDGAKGMVVIKQHGGITIAQDLAEAQFPAMPKASIDKKAIRQVMKLDQINKFLMQIIEL